MEVIKQVFKSGDIWVVVVGLLIIIIAIVIGVFKQYWLIAGVNTAPKKELEKIDLEYIGKYFGIFLGIYGLSLMLSPLIFRYLNIMNYFHYYIPITTFAFVVFMFLYGHLKRDRIYKKMTS